MKNKWVRTGVVSLFAGLALSAGAAVAPVTNSLPGALTNADPRLASVPRSRPLVPDDFIHVEVYQEPDLEARRRVAKDGTITLPLLNQVRVAGKTVEEVTALIREGLARDYLVNPRVTVTVLEYAKWKFTVAGQVLRPGEYEVNGGETLTIIQAILKAGWVTSKGKLTNVKVTRAGQANALVIDVNAMMRSPSVKPFEIHPDDIITVEERVL
jgi:polysaccharide export outer membrane protein